MALRIAALVLSALVAPSAFAQGMVERFQPGNHYFVIEPAVSGSAPAGKIEVVEAFSAGCIHCANFQPKVDAWMKTKPADVHYTYIPATFNAPFALFARGYYAAEALGIAEKSHQALFNAVFIEKKPFRSVEDLADFYATQGAKREDFLAAANSFAIQTKLNRATKLLQSYKIDGTPNLIVAGKYRVSGESAGGYDNVFQVVDFLINKERLAAKNATAAK